jgi:ABC-type lipoprotein release transport system permease subunit
MGAKIVLIFKLAFRNLARRKIRTAIIIFTISLGLWGILSAVSFTRGALSAMVYKAIYYDCGHIIIQNNDALLGNPSKFSVKRINVADIRGLVNVKSLSEKLKLSGLLGVGDAAFPVTLVGVDAKSEVNLSEIPKTIISGRYLTGKDAGIVISRGMSGYLKVKAGDEISFTAADMSGDIRSVTFTVNGVYDTGLRDYDRVNCFADLEYVKQNLGYDLLSEINIIVKDPYQIGDTRKRIDELIKGENVNTFDWKDKYPILVQYQLFFEAIVWVYYLLIYLAIAIVVLNVFFIVIFERIKEYGLQAALGTDRYIVAFSIVLECLLTGLMSLALGILMSWLTISILARTGIDLSFFAMGLREIGLPSKIFPEFSIRDLLAPSVLMVLTCVLASLYPAYKASRFSPIDALKHV